MYSDIFLENGTIQPGTLSGGIEPGTWWARMGVVNASRQQHSYAGI